MQGLRDPSFFPTKKNPVPAGDEEERIMPAAKDSLKYFSITSVSGLDREKQAASGGGGVPDLRSIAQSYSRCGGRHVA